MNVPGLSPTVAVGCLELLGIIERNSVTRADASSISFGAIPSQDVVSTAFNLGWVEVSETGRLLQTPKGERAFSLSDMHAGLRVMLLDHIEAVSPPWAQLAPAGRRDVLGMAPPGVRQIIVDAGLAHGDDEETVRFWDMLAARARGLRDSRLSDIGRQGERLTVEHERKRTGIAPKWIALESNSDGYDILSRVIDRASGLLTIEVKTTTVSGLSGYFHVTRKEWEVATLSLNHCFHLWDISSQNPQLAVLDVEAVASHISNDLGDGLWESVKIPFSTFRNSFTNE